MNEGLTVSFQSGEADGRLAGLVLETLKISTARERRRWKELNVVLAGDELLQRLNRDYLGFDEVTDVLSFDLGDDPGGAIEGEIYVSTDRARVQADERGVTFEFELLHLVVHGLLHLCGYDHEDDASLLQMNDRGEQYVRSVLEREIVGG